MSNYPPGVTGSEYQISGADYENERRMPFDMKCSECDALIEKGTAVTVQAHHSEGMWMLCPFCEEVVDLTEDQWDVIDRAPRRLYERSVQAKVKRFYADYAEETKRLVAAGVTDETSRAMNEPRICHMCARVYPGGGECRGTAKHPHRVVVLYASNE